MFWSYDLNKGQIYVKYIISDHVISKVKYNVNKFPMLKAEKYQG